MQTKNLIRIRRRLEQELADEKRRNNDSVAECIRKCKNQTREIRKKEQRKIRDLLSKIEDIKRREKRNKYIKDYDDDDEDDIYMSSVRPKKYNRKKRKAIQKKKRKNLEKRMADEEAILKKLNKKNKA